MKKRRKIRYIVVHHSLTKDGPRLSWPAFRRYHIHERGWRDVGYHLGIDNYEGYYEVLIGRPWTMVGAHAPGRNLDSLGICIIGNFDEAPPPPDQWNAAIKLVSWLTIQLHISVGRVIGHREATKNRTCPGKYFDLNEFRRAVDVHNNFKN